MASSSPEPSPRRIVAAAEHEEHARARDGERDGEVDRRPLVQEHEREEHRPDRERVVEERRLAGRDPLDGEEVEERRDGAERRRATRGARGAPAGTCPGAPRRRPGIAASPKEKRTSVTCPPFMPMRVARRTRTADSPKKMLEPKRSRRRARARAARRAGDPARRRAPRSERASAGCPASRDPTIGFRGPYPRRCAGSQRGPGRLSRRGA